MSIETETFQFTQQVYDDVMEIPWGQRANDCFCLEKHDDYHLCMPNPIERDRNKFVQQLQNSMEISMMQKKKVPMENEQHWEAHPQQNRELQQQKPKHLTNEMYPKVKQQLVEDFRASVRSSPKFHKIKSMGILPNEKVNTGSSNQENGISGENSDIAKDDNELDRNDDGNEQTKGFPSSKEFEPEQEFPKRIDLHQCADTIGFTTPTEATSAKGTKGTKGDCTNISNVCHRTSVGEVGNMKLTPSMKYQSQNHRQEQLNLSQRTTQQQPCRKPNNRTHRMEKLLDKQQQHHSASNIILSGRQPSSVPQPPPASCFALFSSFPSAPVLAQAKHHPQQQQPQHPFRSKDQSPSRNPITCSQNNFDGPPNQMMRNTLPSNPFLTNFNRSTTSKMGIGNSTTFQNLPQQKPAIRPPASQFATSNRNSSSVLKNLQLPQTNQDHAPWGIETAAMKVSSQARLTLLQQNAQHKQEATDMKSVPHHDVFQTNMFLAPSATNTSTFKAAPTATSRQLNSVPKTLHSASSQIAKNIQGSKTVTTYQKEPRNSTIPPCNSFQDIPSQENLNGQKLQSRNVGLTAAAVGTTTCQSALSNNSRLCYSKSVPSFNQTCHRYNGAECKHNQDFIGLSLPSPLWEWKNSNQFGTIARKENKGVFANKKAKNLNRSESFSSLSDSDDGTDYDNDDQSIDTTIKANEDEVFACVFKADNARSIASLLVNNTSSPSYQNKCNKSLTSINIHTSNSHHTINLRQHNSKSSICRWDSRGGSSTNKLQQSLSRDSIPTLPRRNHFLEVSARQNITWNSEVTNKSNTND